MIRKNLDPVESSEYLAPNPENLGDLKPYYHCATVRVTPPDGYDISQDTGEIFILKSCKYHRYTNLKDENQLQRGYFAVGEENDGDILFKIFVPYASIKPGFSNKSLKAAINGIAMEFNGEGFTIPPSAIEYQYNGNNCLFGYNLSESSIVDEDEEKGFCGFI